ncbi:MAG: Uncharacterised protein [Hyphomonas sp. TMED17]|nr:MAG: Uncharacterised protein [Hyphomonas sp. TMED17]
MGCLGVARQSRQHGFQYPAFAARCGRRECLGPERISPCQISGFQDQIDTGQSQTLGCGFDKPVEPGLVAAHPVEISEVPERVGIVQTAMGVFEQSLCGV